MAQSERRLKERTPVGLDAARAHGRKGSRPPMPVGDPRIQTAKKLHADKSNSIGDIRKTLQISRPTLYRWLEFKSHSAVESHSANSEARDFHNERRSQTVNGRTQLSAWTVDERPNEYQRCDRSAPGCCQRHRAPSEMAMILSSTLVSRCQAWCPHHNRDRRWNLQACWWLSVIYDF
jgi:hypothetical protein